MNRRDMIKLLTGAVAAPAVLSNILFNPLGREAMANTANAKNITGKVEKLILTDAEWKKRLPADQYQVLRHDGTESPGSSPLLHEKRAGNFLCVGCDLDLFSSKAKYDSGTGWPSFYDAIPGHINTKTDESAGMVRTEIHCARCEGHHGHVFNDGPKPTGLRYCTNGIVLKFRPDAA